MEEILSLSTDLFKILGDTSRLKIILLLREGEKSPKEIEDFLEKSQSTVSQHLKILTDADIIEFEKNGKSKTYSLKNNQILRIIESIKRYIIQQQKKKAQEIQDLDRFDTLL